MRQKNSKEKEDELILLYAKVKEFCQGDRWARKKKACRVRNEMIQKSLKKDGESTIRQG